MNSQPMSIGGRLLTLTEAQSVRRHLEFHRKIAARAINLPPVLPPSIPHAPEPDPPRMTAPYSFKETWFSMVAPATRKLSLMQIKEMVCDHFGITVNDITSQRRTKDVVIPRLVAMYLSKELTGKSLPEIARHFGDRDHTCVLNATRRVPVFMKDDAELATEVTHIRNSLEALL